MALLVLGRHGQGLVPAQLGENGQGHPALFPGIVLACLGKEGLRLPLPFRTGAQHGGAYLVLIVSVGEAPGEGGLQGLPLCRGGGAAAPEGGGIHPGDQGDILRPLHPPLNLHTGHPHVLQLRQGIHQG